MRTEAIVAVDPGSSESGVVIVRGGELLDKGVTPNERLLAYLRRAPLADPSGRDRVVPRTLAIERPGGYAVGTHAARHLFETLEWSGRFLEAWEVRGGRAVHVGRPYVKAYLLGTPKGDDRDVRRALIGKLGGRACRACVDGVAFGTPRPGAKRPPRCATCSGTGWRYVPPELRELRADSDAWAALGVALTYRDEADLGRRT